MQQRGSYEEDEIDLREVVRVLLRNWIILVAFALLGAVIGLGLSLLQRPVYQATAQIIVPGEVYSYSPVVHGVVSGVYDLTTDFSSLLLGSQVRQAVAQKMGVAVETLPGAGAEHPGINIFPVGKTGPQLYSITVRSGSPQQAAQIANAWADAALSYLDQPGQLSAQADKARMAVQDADRALVDYLAKNQLGQLTWANLQMLTGVGVANNLMLNGQAQAGPGIVQSDAQPMPSVTPAQRLQLRDLMQARVDAQAEYDYFHSAAIQASYAGPASTPLIQSYAAVPRFPVEPRTRLNTAFGALIGLAASALALYLRSWWRGGEGNPAK